MCSHKNFDMDRVSSIDHNDYLMCKCWDCGTRFGITLDTQGHPTKSWLIEPSAVEAVRPWPGLHLVAKTS